MWYLIETFKNLESLESVFILRFLRDPVLTNEVISLHLIIVLEYLTYFKCVLSLEKQDFHAVKCACW